ncbi:uncharacterized protein N7459_002971 [Penicillium hispanicum]|uniref:uncharacterized protein n=1 Tax=Penicillium hispanicum TaxID=1080232 RepID=UPI0025400C37|nr:uncharacterized protein N7459_002971 [Penicillium hispanicum]KAJ5587206.1 hypothetical protein N7459_002971 [Penicillium hispanicum]
MPGDNRRPGDSTQVGPAGASSSVPYSGAPGPASDGAQTTKSRRRRRLADGDSHAGNQSFYFVDSTSSSKEKRAHVMRHHVQEKRKQRKVSHGTIPTEHLQELSSWPAGKDSRYDADHRKEAASVSAPGTLVDQDSSLPIRFSAVKPYVAPTMPLQIGSPMTMLDASRNDPFSTLPMAHDPEVRELVDYWTTKLTYWSGQNSYVKNQMFRTAMEHPISFQAVILGYCARWKAQIHGISDSAEVQRYVGQAKKQIDEALSGALPVPKPSLVCAMTGMALGEERFGSKEDSRAYLDQAVHLMRPRTGSDMPVEAFLQYVRYIMPPKSTLIDPSDRRWLVTFLRGAEDLMQKHSDPVYQIQAPRRRHAFQMESPLFSLLSSGPRPSQVPLESRMYVVRDSQTQEVSRTAALIYVTAALWGFNDSPGKTDRFLAYLQAIVEQHELDRHPACETLLWLLLEQGCDADLREPERAWSTGELLRIHKQLRPDLQFHFNEVLMSFLTLQPPIRGIDVFEKELNANV